ncbi:MAG: hypothetical protein K0S49_1055 [Microbacterium sp.]|nr:hypothetical protein [Microbacterium sp.]
MRHARATPEPLGVDVDLRDHRLGTVGQELLVGEVGADHEEEVDLVHGVVDGTVAEQARHADVEAVVVLDPLLAAQRVPHRRLQVLGERDHLVTRVTHSLAGEDRDLLGLVDGRGELGDAALIGSDPARPGSDEGRELTRRVKLGEVAGQHDHRDGRPRGRVTDRGVHHARRLLRRHDHLAVVAALREQPFGVRLLEVTRPDLQARDVAGDREHRHTGSLRIEEAVDQVQVAGTAASCAHGQLAGELGVRCRSEGGGLLVADVDPVDPARRCAPGSSHRVDDRIE